VYIDAAAWPFIDRVSLQPDIGPLETGRTFNASKQAPSMNGVFMSLIKKSDVRRHTSTGSREAREIKRPYGADATPVKSEQGSTPAKVKAEKTPATPKE
jgi:hypothetical protein